MNESLEHARRRILEVLTLREDHVHLSRVWARAAKVPKVTDDDKAIYLGLSQLHAEIAALYERARAELQTIADRVAGESGGST